MYNPIEKPVKKYTPTVPFVKDLSIPGFFRSWINTPEYRERLNVGYSNPEEVRRNRLFAIDNLNIRSTFHESSASAPPTPTSQANVYINPKDSKSVLAHEVSHATGAVDGITNNGLGISKQETDIIKNAIIKTQPKIYGAQGSDEQKKSLMDYGNWKHLSQPKEVKADLDANRYQLFKKGVFDITEGKEFTTDDLKKAKESLKDDNSFNRLLEQVGEENYINLMNTIASGDSKPNRLFS